LGWREFGSAGIMPACRPQAGSFEGRQACAS
jgi:hypothetical protein